jgi:hypothetical protein
MLEDHYSKITPELMASVFAGPKMGRQKDLEIDSIAKVVLGTVSAAADNASKK